MTRKSISIVSVLPTGEISYPGKYAAAYGHFRPVIAEVVRNYLSCGDLSQSFARVRCSDCGHEYLLAYSCKGRYFCTSCHRSQAVAFSEWLNETVLWPVPHRQIVLTVPKMLRIYFRYDRRLLGKLCRLASRVITKSFRALAGRFDLEPGMVVCVQTFGNFANFHPHLHVLVTDGGFVADGTFYVLPKVSLSGMEQLFRHRVLKMMLREGLINQERVRLLLSWRHSGFNVDGSVRVRASDAKGRENIARYLIRAPFSVDPLLCPECGSAMKIIAFIEEDAIIRKILEHLRLREEPEPRAPPPLPAQMDIEYLPFLDG